MIVSDSEMVGMIEHALKIKLVAEGELPGFMLGLREGLAARFDSDQAIIVEYLLKSYYPHGVKND